RGSSSRSTRRLSRRRKPSTRIRTERGGWCGSASLTPARSARCSTRPTTAGSSKSSSPRPGMSFLSLTEHDRGQMLEAIGVDSVDELFEQIPTGVRLGRALALEPPLSEPELVVHLSELASRNVDTGREISFLGAGISDHYVPAVVDAVLARGELLTAYTPYQPEMSQGVLQAIIEYQTAICELTGMDVSNASGYDGTTVAADACYVAKHVTGRSRVVLAETLNPQVRQVVKTYAPGFGLEVVEVPHRDGITDPDELAEAARDAACVIFQQPNFFGCLEPAPDLASAANDAGALPVAHVDPVSLGVLEAPGNYGCAIAIGEGQGAGNYQSFGGPHYGFIAVRAEHTRRMPGRIVGETTDAAGRRGFVLTLQTREQHIRREKATHNICTAQALNALAGMIYLSWLGRAGVDELGELLVSRTHYARETLTALDGVEAWHEQPVVREFALKLAAPVHKVIERCAAEGVNPGYPLEDDGLLVAITEQEIVRHYNRLSKRNFDLDTGFYPLGSCTMKHNPKLHERVAALPGNARLHPLQTPRRAQGALQLMYELQQSLGEIAGLPHVSLQPSAGSHGELAGVL